MTVKCYNCRVDLPMDETIVNKMPTASKYFICDRCSAEIGSDYEVEVLE